MSVLDDNLEEHLSSVIYKTQIESIRTLYTSHSLFIVDDPEPPIYHTEYRKDYLLQLSSGNTWGHKSRDIIYVRDLSLENGNYLDVCRDCVSVYLEPKPYASYFTYVRLLIENDELILEPIDKTAPILIRDLNAPIPGAKFRCPDWYRGYVRAVDCNDVTIRETFGDFMVITETSIVQSLNF